MRHSLLKALIVVASATALFALQHRAPPLFVNVATEAGVVFKHENGATAEKYLPETMAGGGLIFDYNRDGWPDIFLVNGGSLADKGRAAKASHRLLRNTRDGKFVDSTASSGIGLSGFGMGACSADYDNDGWSDLYVTAFGPDKLYRNTGGAGFHDVTDAAGIGSDLWSTSCAWADIDNDGDVDLYVARYVDFTVEKNRKCILVGNVPGYCHPNMYSPVPDVLYRNDGDGVFTDISAEAGIDKLRGNGLGVVFGDYDGDGWIDIYVANDSTPNFLFHNKGKGLFEEVGLWAGVSVASDGKPLAGMGADIGDYNGDGLADLFVTNLDGQTHTLYKNLGKGLFADVTFLSGIATATLPFVGFGTAFLDYDNDGDLDLTVANGDVLDNVKRLRPTASYEQLNLLLQNDGAGRFKSVGSASGPGFAIKKASRALAVGDIDNDGDLDILVSNVGQTADLLRNDGGNRGNALLVNLVGSQSNRDGVGALVKLSVDKKVFQKEVKAGSSYLAQNDLRVHFGLGQAQRADRLEIRWPSGVIDTIENIEANEILTILEGAGVTGRKPF